MSATEQPKLEPFALQLYRRFLLEGKKVSQLSEELDIPRERIVVRINAAIAYCAKHPEASPTKIVTA